MPDPASLKRDLDALRIHRPDRPGPAAAAEPGSGYSAPPATRRVARRRRWPFVLALFLLAVAAAALLNEKYGEILTAPEVTVARVVSRDSRTRAVVLTMAGYVVADRKATVGPQIPGRLEHLYFDEGDTVEEGQELARLNDAWYVAQSESIRASLGIARLRAERTKNLFESGSGSEDDYDKARFEVASLEARLRQADEEKSFTVIRSPISGRVVRRDAEIGELVTPGGGPGDIKTAIISLVDPSTFEVEVDVNETDVAKVALGRRADVTLDAYPAKTYPGFVRKIAPIANRQKGTIQIKVRFERVDDDVRPEMTARVALLEDKAPSAEAEGGRKLFVPTEALVSAGTGRTRAVFVVDRESRARRRDVEVGGQKDGLSQALSGLEEGEDVIVSGLDRVKDGGRVRVAGR